MKLTLDDVKRVDPTAMYSWIRDFPLQAEDAVRIAQKARLTIRPKGITSIVLAGMGGSAIGGDLVRSYLSAELKIPFAVSRSYTLPAYVGRSTLVVVSSYSGNTEETLSCYREAIRRRAHVLCITTGGVVERLARKYKHSVIKVPPGLQPRAALGYSFFPLLVALAAMGFIRSQQRDIKEAISGLKFRSQIYRDPGSSGNLPLKVAQRLHGRLPIFYSASDHLDAVNVRWRGQISENAKQLAFGHVLPEMNHNEIVGWKVDRALMKNMTVVFLRDRGTHPRVQLREEITRKIIKAYASDVLVVSSEGRSLLARIISLVYVGDWVSYYLAILNKQNPTPVTVIEYLKNELGKA
ncbi:MAG: bifunctional phosphoglucose/phosphomannose isomerase [Ignavibacteriales bacterium]|nr:bifunctional phosphoglucose/phosphomannose isomerase [Ignavibacteriales bacterium]